MRVRNHPQGSSPESESSTLSATELPDLFGDEPTRRVFDVVSEEPRCGRAAREKSSVFRTAAYRRLDRLTEARPIASEYQLSLDDSHRRQFVATARQISISFDDRESNAVVKSSE